MDIANSPAALAAAHQRFIFKRAKDQETEDGLEAIKLASEIIALAERNRAGLTKSPVPTITKRLRPVAPPTPAELKKQEIIEFKDKMATRSADPSVKLTDIKTLMALMDQLTELERAGAADIFKSMGPSKGTAALRNAQRIEAGQWRRKADEWTDPAMKRACIEKAVEIEKEIL
jgi:hypothetical protein